jgi:CRISPR-associated protein Cas1
MGMEGNASRVFFSAWFRALGWTRRAPRCKPDIPNVLLDIGYTHLFHFVEALLSLYGFDLYCGVHHTFFYQRKSLVCDLVEPFRCIIGRRVRKAHNLGQITPDDFFQKDGQWHLVYKDQDKYVRLFLKDILGEKQKIFLFCQSYYRWFMRDRPMDLFPVYSITGD